MTDTWTVERRATWEHACEQVSVVRARPSVRRWEEWLARLHQGEGREAKLGCIWAEQDLGGGFQPGAKRKGKRIPRTKILKVKCGNVNS